MAVVRTNSLQLLAYAAFSTSGMALPIYAAQIGASFEFIGLIGAAHGVATVLSEGLFGRLGDRVDRRRLLVIGFGVAAAAYALQFFARGPPALLIVRFFTGFAAGMIPATLAAYVYEIRRPLGKFTSYNAAGWLIGSLLVTGVGLFGTYTFRTPWLESLRVFEETVGPFQVLFLLSALFCLIGWAVAWRLKPMRVRLEAPLMSWKLLRSNVHVYAPMFLRHLGATTIWVIFPLYVLELGGDLALVGWLHVINMVSQIVVLRNAERWRTLGHPRVLMAIGLALSAFTFFAFTLVQNAMQLLPLQVLIGVSFACLFLGSLKEVLQHNVERATATGMLNASMGLSNVAGPLIGGVVAAAVGSLRAPLYVGTAIALLGLASFLVSREGARAAPRGPAPQPAGPSGEVGP